MVAGTLSKAVFRRYIEYKIPMSGLSSDHKFHIADKIKTWLSCKKVK
jgi:hypothetical protein